MEAVPSPPERLEFTQVLALLLGAVPWLAAVSPRAKKLSGRPGRRLRGYPLYVKTASIFENKGFTGSYLILKHLAFLDARITPIAHPIPRAKVLC